MSIGIIGGADGPTSIFISSRPGIFLIVGVAAVVGVVAAILIRVARKRNKRF